MIKREDLNGKELQAIQKEMEAHIVTFVAEVSTMDMEQLNSKEAELVTAMTEYDNYLNTVMYGLPREIEFDSKRFSRRDIADRVVEFVNRMEVDWQYTLGMYQMVKLWRVIGDEIGYKEYDSTLRVLGQVKYKGVNDWENILAVNEFLTAPQEQYSRDNIYTAYMAELHNAVINQMNKLSQVPDEHAVATE